MHPNFYIMKKFIFLTIFLSGFITTAQTNKELISHYEAFYKQMKRQGDIQGTINALTHLDILAPNKAKKDTLAYLYLNSNQPVPALNVIGIDKNPSDSNLAVEVKAVALKSVNQAEKALEQYEELFKRSPNVYIAYELADLKTQTGKYEDALKNIEYGLANVKDDMKTTFYETQTPYQVPIQAAFLYMKGLVTFNINKEDFDTPINLMKDALNIEPNFSLAKQIKQVLLQRKAGIDN